MSADKLLHRVEGGPGHVMFFCPGCRCGHLIHVKPDAPNGWDFNGDFDAPTFFPSILARWTQLTAEGIAMLDRGEKPPGGKYPSREIVCHSFVTRGKIKFLADCTHALAGQEVPLEKF